MSISKIVVSAALAAGLMVVGLNGAFAADKPAPMMAHQEIDADKASQHMKKQLGLSDEQTSEVKKIMQDMHKDAEELRAEMEKLKAETDDKFKDVLTPEQYTKWKEMREKRMKRIKG